MNNPITNDVFDSRDLIEYKEYLEQEFLESYNEMMLDLDEDFEEITDIDEVDESMLDANMQEYSDLEAMLKEYEEIKEFCEELESYSEDFEYGESIIHENYFEEYCEDFIKGCGYIADNTPAIIENNIDWVGITEDMKVDYTEVEYNGETYYIR